MRPTFINSPVNQLSYLSSVVIVQLFICDRHVRQVRIDVETSTAQFRSRAGAKVYIPTGKNRKKQLQESFRKDLKRTRQSVDLN